MRLILILVLLATPAAAQETGTDMATRIRIAVEVAKAKAALDAEKSKIDKKEPHVATGPNVFDDYAAAKTEAMKKDSPFLIWVNLEPNGRAAEFPTAIHVRVKEYKGDKSPRLIIATQDGGCMYERTILNTVTSEAIRNAIGPEKVSSQPREKPDRIPDYLPAKPTTFLLPQSDIVVCEST